jgi:plastocyanin
MEHMSCEDWFELVSAAADDQVSDLERARLDEHLAGCPSCASLLATFDDARRRARLQPPVARQDLVAAVIAKRSQHPAGSARPARELARRGAFASVAILAAIVGVGTVAADPEAAPARAEASVEEPSLAAQVLIDAGERSFDASAVEVPAGTTVEWRNAGSHTHHLVRSLGGATVVEDLSPGSSEVATFAEPGTYDYWCTIHPEMAGTVTVDA